MRHRHRERGQTILLVAVSIVSLLAMAALAIDVVSLYVARAEVQRAADALALVGAKAVADSGVTSLPPGDSNAVAAKALAASMAQAAITALLSATPSLNRVSGRSPSVVSMPTIIYNDPLGNGATNNPLITVTLQQTGLPTFFAKVFGQQASTTTATAIAEAYNPANTQSFTPVTPRCVKPWLVANGNAAHGGPPFIDPVTGAVANAATLLGSSIFLEPDCNTTFPNSCPLQANPPDFIGSDLKYVPALITPNATNVCPSSCVGPSDYERSIACCDQTTYSCGGSVNNANWDPAISPNPAFGGPGSATDTATECLIHATSGGPGSGQDLMPDFAPWPSQGAPQITAGSGPMNGQFVSTSSSIVTVPIIDTSAGSINNPPFGVRVLGFLQGFIQYVDDGPSRHTFIKITVMNVVGCSRTPNGNSPVVGGNGASAVAVRLVAQP